LEDSVVGYNILNASQSNHSQTQKEGTKGRKKDAGRKVAPKGIFTTVIIACVHCVIFIHGSWLQENVSYKDSKQ
jgi:hypothetical protein